MQLISCKVLITSKILKLYFTDATATTSNQTGDNITMKEILLHWKYRQDLVHACWRGGRFASKEVDSIENFSKEDCLLPCLLLSMVEHIQLECSKVNLLKL